MQASISFLAKFPSNKQDMEWRLAGMNISNRFYLHTSDLLLSNQAKDIAHLSINMYALQLHSFLDPITVLSPEVTFVGSFGRIWSSYATSVRQRKKPNHFFPERAFHTSPSL